MGKYGQLLLVILFILCMSTPPRLHLDSPSKRLLGHDSPMRHTHNLHDYLNYETSFNDDVANIALIESRRNSNETMDLVVNKNKVCSFSFFLAHFRCAGNWIVPLNYLKKSY